MIGIVESRADEASVAICDQLRTLADWETSEDTDRDPADGGGTVYATAGFELRSFEALHLYLERPAEAFSTEPSLLVFASRHSGETGPLLTGHFTGNVGPGAYGGDDRSLARAAPNALVALLEAFDEYAPAGYDVGMECTHHGPTDVGCPSLFAELGSEAHQWRDPAGAAAVARAILDLEGTPADRSRQVVGFGGGHYVPRFERIVRETPWAVGHVAPDWALSALGEPSAEIDLLAALFERSNATIGVVEGEYPGLIDAIESRGYRVVSEAWLRAVDDWPLELVGSIEGDLGPVADGVELGQIRRADYTVVSLPEELVATAEGIDPDATWAVVDRNAVAFETDNGGSRLGGRVAVPIDTADDSGNADVGEESTDSLPPSIVAGLADVLRERYDDVEISATHVVATESAFDPARARERGVPEGPAFGRLADGEAVTVDGQRIEPADVHVERTDEFSL